MIVILRVISTGWLTWNKWKMFFSHTTGGLRIGHVTYGGQLHPPLLTCFPTLAPTDFKFSFSCSPILCMYMYKFLVEFARRVRLWRSAWHGYHWCVRDHFSYRYYCTVNSGGTFQWRHPWSLAQDFHEEEQRRWNDCPLQGKGYGKSHLSLHARIDIYIYYQHYYLGKAHFYLWIARKKIYRCSRTDFITFPGLWWQFWSQHFCMLIINCNFVLSNNHRVRIT